MILNITPIVDIFLYLLTLGIGLDFTWCGYWLLKTNKMTHIPRLLGYLTLKIFEKASINNNETKIVKIMFSMKTASIYMLLGGPLLIVGSVLALLGLLS